MNTSRTKKIPLPMDLWATLIVALSGILYGLIGYFGTRLMEKGLTVYTMLFWRFFIAFLWISFCLWITKERLLNSPRKEKNFYLKTLLYVAITYSGASAFYFMASQQIGTGLAMVIFFSYPVFVAMTSWLFQKNPITLFSVSSLILIGIGIYLLKGTGETALSFTGIGLAITASLFYASYISRSKHQTQSLTPQMLTMLVCFGNTGIFLILSIGSHSFQVPSSFGEWVEVFSLGIFATALPIQLLLAGLKYISTLKASILSVLEPVVTLVVGSFFLKETICQTQILGIAIVLIGAIVIQFEQ